MTPHGNLPPRDGALWRPTHNGPVACKKCHAMTVDWPVVSWHLGRSTWLLRLQCRECAWLEYVPVDEDRVSGYANQYGAWRRA